MLFQPEGEDDLKKRQLMELAIINGTYRDTKALGPGGVPGGPSPARKWACRFGPHASPHC